MLFTGTVSAQNDVATPRLSREQLFELPVKEEPPIRIRNIRILQGDITQTLHLTLHEFDGKFETRLRINQAAARDQSHETLLRQLADQSFKRGRNLVDAIHDATPLTGAQQAQLQNAVKADTMAVARRLKQQYAEGFPTQHGRYDPRDVQELNNFLSRKMWGTESIFTKVFNATLSDKQKATIGTSYIEWFSTRVRQLGPEDRKRLVAVMMSHQDQASPALGRQAYAAAIVLSIPADELSDALDGRQLRYTRILAAAWKPANQPTNVLKHAILPTLK